MPSHVLRRPGRVSESHGLTSYPTTEREDQSRKSIACRATRASPLPEQFLPSQNRNYGTAALQLLSFEVDIWGKLRRATEAARANLLGADETRNAVITTLVSDVATAYLTMRELDYELEVSTRTLRTREESLELKKSREEHGVPTELDLRQAEQLVYTASETIPEIQRQIEQTENQISLLLGESPNTVIRGKSPYANSSFRRKSHPVYPRHCSSVDLISAPPSRIWSQPTLRSAWRERPTSRP